MSEFGLFLSQFRTKILVVQIRILHVIYNLQSMA